MEWFETTRPLTKVYQYIGTKPTRQSDYMLASFELSAGMTYRIDKKIVMDAEDGVSYFQFEDSTDRTWYVFSTDVRYIPAMPALEPAFDQKKTESAAKMRSVGIIKTRKKENVSEAFRRFNDNEVDVLLINQSGAVGASAHAIPTKKTPKAKVKQRVMIVLQAELDIAKEVQKRGRINRTGQIFKPIYDYLTSGIPAEKRLMMMLKKKLKSLDANTTSNQRNSEDLMKSDDFLNKYGD